MPRARDAGHALHRPYRAYQPFCLRPVGGRDIKHIPPQLFKVASERQPPTAVFAGVKRFVLHHTAVNDAEVPPHFVVFRRRVSPGQPVDAVVDTVAAAVPGGQISARRGAHFVDRGVKPVQPCVYARGQPRDSPADYHYPAHFHIRPSVFLKQYILIVLYPYYFRKKLDIVERM